MDLEGLTFLCNACLNLLVNGSLIDKAYCLLQGMMGKAYGDNVKLHKLFQDKKGICS